jgi:hypothetical protein
MDKILILFLRTLSKILEQAYTPPTIAQMCTMKVVADWRLMVYWILIGESSYRKKMAGIPMSSLIV